MKVAVIGAGIAGVTTAYELACDGHQVVVFERRDSVAAESSFAHSGLMSASALVPWVVPRGFGSRQPAPWRPALPNRATAWFAGRTQARQAQAHEANCVHLRRLAALSRERQLALVRSLNLDHERADGHLMLLRTPKDMAHAQPALDVLARLGTRFEQLDREHCLRIEPGLGDATPLQAGIFFPGDEVGNCREFAHLLRLAAQRLGVRFRFHTQVQAINPGAPLQLVHRSSPPQTAATTFQRAATSSTNNGHVADTQPVADETITESVDAVVVCAALDAPALLAPLRIQLAQQVAYGHSITAPLRTSEMFPNQGPRAALTDARHGVSISRLGQRVRIAGSFETGGSLAEPQDGAFKVLYEVLHDWFPGAARMTHVQRWKGALAFTRDGSPVLGASGVAGVWLNLGHGANGWALACGSARVVADAVSGRPASIDTDGLGISRLPG